MGDRCRWSGRWGSRRPLGRRNRGRDCRRRCRRGNSHINIPGNGVSQVVICPPGCDQDTVVSWVVWGKEGDSHGLADCHRCVKQLFIDRFSIDSDTKLRVTIGREFPLTVEIDKQDVCLSAYSGIFFEPGIADLQIAAVFFHRRLGFDLEEAEAVAGEQRENDGNENNYCHFCRFPNCPLHFPEPPVLLSQE